MLFNDKNNSKAFTEGTIHGTLKNPNEYRESIIYEALSHLDGKRLRSFVKSREAQVMINESIISDETLERLTADTRLTDGIQTTVCHIAKDIGDPEWDALVQARLEERRIMNDLLSKYGDKAEALIKDAYREYIETCIPKSYRD